MKKFIYKGVAGTHWPDAEAGDNLYYSLDLACWLNNEEDSLTGIQWFLPKGVTSDDSYVSGTEASIKLRTEYPGIYKIRCKVTSVDSGKEQSNVVPMLLKVF